MVSVSSLRELSVLPSRAGPARDSRRPRTLKEMDRTFALGLDQSARGDGAAFKTRPDQRDSRLVGIWHEEHRPGNVVRYGSFVEEKLNTFHTSIMTSDIGHSR